MIWSPIALLLVNYSLLGNSTTFHLHSKESDYQYKVEWCFTWDDVIIAKRISTVTYPPVEIQYEYVQSPRKYVACEVRGN